MIITQTNSSWNDRNSITDAATGSDPSSNDDLSCENKRIWANDSRSAFHFPSPATQHTVLTIYLRTTHTMITIHMAMTRAMYSLTRQPSCRSVFHAKGCRRLSSMRCDANGLTRLCVSHLFNIYYDY